MYNNTAYMYPQQQQQMHHQQMQQRQQMQMQQQQQRQMQMQQQQRMQQQQQQQMHHQQQQQQIYQARKQQVQEKHQQILKKKSATDDDDDDEEYSEDEDDDDDEDEDEDEDEDDEEEYDDEESFSSLSDLLSSSESEAGSDVADKERAVTFDSESKTKAKTKPTSKSKSETKKSFKASKAKSKTKTKSKSKTDAKAEEKKAVGDDENKDEDEDEDENNGATTGTDANVANEMQRLALANNVVVAPTRIPSSALSPGEYMYSVISDVLATNNKKNFQRILARTPLPIALKYLHQIAQRAFATGNRDIHKVVLDTNKKYNIVSDVFIDAFTKGDSKSIFNAMTYLGKTVHAFSTAGAEFNTDELLKFFTPEFIAMNLIQSGNIEAYDRVMTEFKNEEIRISRGFHVAKALIAAYAGIPKFFSNQKRYTFTREIVILAICGGSTETLDYVIKKTKMGKMSHDIVMEARSCQPIPAGMMKHLVEKYNVSEMSV